jgi:hypothetical protein
MLSWNSDHCGQYGALSRGEKRFMVNLKRREFIALLAGVTTAWPVVAYAQQRAKVARLVVLIFSTPRKDPWACPGFV